jgi:hypothetical protein
LSDFISRRHVDQQPQALLMRHRLEMLTEAFDVPANVQRTRLDQAPALLGEFEQAALSRSAPAMELQPTQQVRLLNVVECHGLPLLALELCRLL